VQSFDYRANSYHIYLNTLGFHGCGKEISQICPCSFCPIKTSFSGTPSPSCHSTAQNPLRRWHHPRTPRTPTKPSSPVPQVFDLHLARKWPSTSPCLRSVHYPSFSRLYCIFFHSQFLLLNIPFFAFFSFILKIFRIWPTRS